MQHWGGGGAERRKKTRELDRTEYPLTDGSLISRLEEVHYLLYTTLLKKKRIIPYTYIRRF